MADFDSTLYFLDEDEVGYLRREIDREYAHDLRGNVIAALLDIFELHADTAARGEVLEHAQVLLPHLLAAEASAESHICCVRCTHPWPRGGHRGAPQERLARSRIRSVRRIP